MSAAEAVARAAQLLAWDLARPGTPEPADLDWPDPDADLDCGDGPEEVES